MTWAKLRTLRSTDHHLRPQVIFCVQGVVSPCLSNIYLHYVLDDWFEGTVKPRLRGRAILVRFADDLVMAFENILDAERVQAVLGKRFARYGLTLHPDKTRFIDFRSKRPNGKRHSATSGTTFDFLGFTHVWGKSRAGADVVKQVTAKGRYARALAAVTDWCRRNRHRPILDQYAHLSAMMRGHYAYYGISGNSRGGFKFRNEHPLHVVTKRYWPPSPPVRRTPRQASRNQASYAAVR
jgi:RNA-directed DNA polymerase